MREEPEKFKGVEVVEQSVRSYPHRALAAHLVGWVRQISAEEINARRFAGYGPSDLVGKAGLEATYERWLRGEPGEERFLVNSDGEVLREFDLQAGGAGSRPPAVAGPRRPADRRGGARRRDRAGADRLRREHRAQPGRERRRRGRDRSEDGGHRRHGVVADVRALMVRARAHGGAALPAVRERDRPHAQPGDTDHVRARLDVQALRGARCREGGDRDPRAATTTVPPSTSIQATSRARSSTTGTASAPAHSRSPRASRSRATRSTTSGGATSTSGTPERTIRSSSGA